MMFKKTTSLALSVLATLACASAVAATPKQAALRHVGKEKVYAAFNVGYAMIDERVDGQAEEDNKGWAYNINAGYMLNEGFGVEVGYTLYPDESFASVKGTENHGMHAAIKAVMPLDVDYNFFAKAGVVKMHHKVNGATTVNDAAGTYEDYTGMGAVGVEDQLNSSTTMVAQVLATMKQENIPATVMVSFGLGFSV